LRALYGEAVPQRGAVAVELREAQYEGTTGVVASVLGLLTGAAGDGGFAGLGGQFVRRGLLRFNVPIETELRFTRTDTGQSVLAHSHVQEVAGDPQTRRLMQLCLTGQASAEESAEFGSLWQDRVRRILLEHAHDDAVFSIRAV